MRRFANADGVHNATPDRVVFGPGTVGDLPAEVDRLGLSRALVVSTPGRVDLAERLAASLGDRCVGVLPEAVSQVPVELNDRGRQVAADLAADALVAVGGGASTGLCKGISYEAALPIVSVPTTYSGSEMTGFCGMTIDGVKRMHESRRMLARVVIYDAELTMSLPLHVSASSAMNALAHCIDSAYLPSTSPVHQLAATEGARVLSQALPGVLKDPDDVSGRNELLYGAHLAGAALTGGFALQHAIAHMLGGSFGVEHGVAHALVLPYVTAHLVREVPEPMHRIAQAVGTDDLAGHVWDLVREVGLPHRLEDVGLAAGDLDRAVHIAATAEDHDDDGSETGGVANPAPVTADVVRSVLAATWEGTRP